MGSLFGRKSNAQGHSQLSPLKEAGADSAADCTAGACLDLGGDVRLAERAATVVPADFHTGVTGPISPLTQLLPLQVETGLVSVLCL